MRIDENLLKKAHDLGLNVTKVCENALKDMIARIERPIDLKNAGNPTKSTTTNAWWGCPDLNRGHESPSLIA